MGILDKMMIFAAGKEAEGKIPLAEKVLLRKILIVEADENLKQEYLNLLPTGQYDVRGVNNGPDALNTLLTFSPDIMLIDLNIPIMNGKDLLHHMRAIPEYKMTPVLAIAETGDIDTIRQVKLYDGAKGFLIKQNVTPGQTIAALLDLI